MRTWSWVDGGQHGASCEVSLTCNTVVNSALVRASCDGQAINSPPGSESWEGGDKFAVGEGKVVSGQAFSAAMRVVNNS